MTIFGIELTPEIVKAIKEEHDIIDRSLAVSCAWGTCTHIYDPVEKYLHGGWGDALCGCENLPGWRSRHPDGLPKPSVPVKAKGRHGSRVQRSRARRREWRQMVEDCERYDRENPFNFPLATYDEVAYFLSTESLNQ